MTMLVFDDNSQIDHVSLYVNTVAPRLRNTLLRFGFIFTIRMAPGSLNQILMTPPFTLKSSDVLCFRLNQDLTVQSVSEMIFTTL